MARHAAAGRGRPQGGRATVVSVLGLAGLTGLLGLVGCGEDPNDLEDIRRAEAAAATTAPTGPQLEGTLQVMASEQLAEAFDEIDAAFEDLHPLVTVEVDYGGSSLRDLVLADVPADVFASGDPADFDALADDGALAGTPQAFATADGTDYRVVALTSTTNAAAADAFVAFARTGRAEAILTDHGLTPPTTP